MNLSLLLPQQCLGTNIKVISAILVILSMCISSIVSVPKPQECGQTKGCYDGGCTGSSCDFVVSWQEDTTSGIYTLESDFASLGPKGNWMAIGFSADGLMGDDEVLGCAYSGSSGTHFNGRNPSGYSPPILVIDSEVTLVSSSYANNVLSCTLRRPKIAYKSGRVNITESWTYLFARGSVSSMGNANTAPTILPHGSTNRFASSEAFALSSTAAAAGTATTTQAPQISVTKPAECGSTKGCFSKCAGSSCEFVVSWQEDGDYGVYTLTSGFSSDGNWMAIGFSSDQMMGEDDILGCVHSGSDIKYFSGRNKGKNSPAIAEDSEVSGDYTYENGVFSCTIKRKKIAYKTGRNDITKSWIYLFAKGKGNAGNDPPTVSYHKNDRFAASEAVTVASTVDLGAVSLKRDLVKLHGCVMVGAWLFFASVGIMMPRFFKPIFIKKIFSMQYWMAIHRGSLMLTFVLTATGFIVIFVDVKGYAELVGEESYLKGHPIMGIIVMALTLINPIMAQFRPHPGTPKRKYFNFLHWFAGSAGYALAVATVFFGTLLNVADTPEFVKWILVGYVAWHFMAEVAMGFASYYCRTQTSSDDKGPTIVETDKGKQFKTIMLGAHVVVAAAVSITVMVMIAIGEE